MGIIVPKEAMIGEKLVPSQKVKAFIMPVKVLKVKDIFGKLKLKRPVAEIMAETDKELDSKP